MRHGVEMFYDDDHNDGDDNDDDKSLTDSTYYSLRAQIDRKSK